MSSRLFATASAAALFWLPFTAAASAQTAPPPAPHAAEGDPHADADDHEGGDHDDHEVEEIVVQATRSGRLLQNEPIRVEVIRREEIEEKLLMTPGNISTLLAETGGLRVQVTAPSLGASNIRVHGLPGRYTQLLSDGLPIHGGGASSLGLLQIPPTDLGRVEVIKGAASALYGASALGGVINLVSRRPDDAPLGEILLNLTSRNGQDLTAYGSTPLGRGWSASLTAGAHRQSDQDLDGDGWIDTPAYERSVLRPRLFWTGENGASAFFTLGWTTEDRRGGTRPGRVVPDGSPFPQAQDTERLDAGLVAETPAAGGVLRLRAAAARQDHRYLFGAVREDDRHDTGLAELSFSSDAGPTNWTVGAAVQTDDYRSETFPAFNYRYRVPGLFAQVDHDVTEALTLAASARLDAHSEYGGQFSPRLSVLWRPGPWTVRASWSRGFFAPTPSTEETDATGLSRLEPLSGLVAETAQSASVDLGWRSGPWEAGLTLFGSEVMNALGLEDAGPARVRLVNSDGPLRTRGLEALLRWRRDGFTVTGSYVRVDATEPGAPGQGRLRVPLTPRDTAGMVAMWERHGVGRVGIEAYYTGRQRLEDDPYRCESRPYLELGMLGEVNVGRASLFLNLENILNVRQTRYAPLVRPARANDGRWTVDAWAPLDGFVVNGGVRLRFGG